MNSLEIRKKFFDFFIKNGHTQVASSSLIPAEDPTLLFANAGMNQFKDCFLGAEKRTYTRAVTIQKCIRAGGKHNDLDNVGRTKRHLTFFEMMGNFSFGGDYFKKDAIRFAWDFLTQEVKLPADRLYVSIYLNDDEAFEIWHKEIGVPAERIVRLGAKDNFWQMGDTGPCGPCTEIHYDKGVQKAGEENLKVGDDGERFLEIWNLVFMQFDRQPDGTDVPLAKPGVDTGMGLERLACVLQGVDTSFDTDLFAGIMHGIEKLSGKKYAGADTETRTAFCVLADHIRSTSLAIADGGTPSNEGRGYVLRKIIRRAALFAQKLGDALIFPRLVPTLVEEMGTIYPELKASQEMIMTLLTGEVEKFAHNLERGQIILEKYLKESAQTKVITGQQAFTLYDTYGFPPELTNIVVHEKGYTVDEQGFAKEMEVQRLQSGKKDVQNDIEFTLSDDTITAFTGYDQLTTTTKVSALVRNGQQVASVKAGETCWLVTEQSPFYVACGGQINDTGSVTIHGKDVQVADLKKVNKASAVQLTAPATLSVGESVTLTVDTCQRKNTERNHTATHLLQAALCNVLGSHVKQAGSLVNAELLRFDFTHHNALTAKEINTIEQLVNAQIMRNTPVTLEVTTYQQAINQGVKAFFGEKYNPESVRVVGIANFSHELCGGTHVKATGDIGCFKIIQITALSTGVRRITAVTGFEALKLFQHDFETAKIISQEFKVQHEDVLEAVLKQKQEIKEVQRELKVAKNALLTAQIPHMLAAVQTVGSLPFCYVQLENVDGTELRELASKLNQKKPGLYFVVSQNGSSTSSFFALCAAEFTQQCNVTAFAQWLDQYGFKGGGKGATLQGGGAEIPADFKGKIISWLQKK